MKAVLTALCFQTTKKKMFYIFTLTCCPPHSIVLIVLFSDLYLCLETSNFLNKNKPAVCCKFDLFESRVEEEKKKSVKGANVTFIRKKLKAFSMSFKCLSQNWDNVWKTALFYICNKLYKFLKCE